MKRLFFLLILATAIVGCGSSQAAQPTPTPVNHQATASAIQTAISASLYATAVASLAATQTAVVKYGITPTIDTPTPAPTTQSDIGSTQQSDVWSVTLNSVKTSHGDVVAPKTGDIFDLFNLTARNTERKAVNLSKGHRVRNQKISRASRLERSNPRDAQRVASHLLTKETVQEI